MLTRLFIIAIIFLLFTSHSVLSGEKISNQRHEHVKQLLQDGFTACDKGDMQNAEEKWSQAIGFLKEEPDTDKEQADNLVLMGKSLMRMQRQKEALGKFSHALALYRGIADVKGQKICITVIEEISPEALDILGKHIYTTVTPSQDRIKFDKDGYMIGDKPTEEEGVFIRKALREHLEGKENRSEYEEKIKVLIAEGVFSTDCYEVLTPKEMIKRFPRMAESLQTERAIAEKIMPNILTETLTKLETMKKRMKSNQKKQIETLDLVIRELTFIKAVAFAKYVLLSRVNSDVIYPGLNFFEAIEEYILSYGLRFTNCGFFDGDTLTCSPMLVKDWIHVAERGMLRIKEGRWKGAYQSQEGYIMLPGIKCFAEDTGRMRVEVPDKEELIILEE